MSLKSWIEEFYPVEASEIESLEEMHRLTLLKWEGLRKENLEKHGLTKRDNLLVSPNPTGFDYFIVDSGTCAYCQEYLENDNYEGHPRCTACPLAKVKYDGDFLGLTEDSPLACQWQYTSFCAGSNPEPMIELIKKAIEDYNKGK